MRLLAIGFVCSAMAIGQVHPVLLLHPDYKPLTARQRLDYYLHRAFGSPAPYLGALAAGGFDQVAKAPPEWNQGAGGFARRAASGYGFIEIQTAARNGLSAAMGLEPRYIRCDCKGFLPRTGHAIKMSFLTWDNQGRTRPDLPVLAGAYAGGMISQLWYPARYNPLTDGVRAGTKQLGAHVAADVFREFAPELKRTFHLGH